MECQREVADTDVIFSGFVNDTSWFLIGAMLIGAMAMKSGLPQRIGNFVISRVGTVAGCRVLSGTIERGSRLRIIRDSRIVGDYAMESLRREKDDTKEVARGMECGIKLANFNDIKEGDVLDAYKIEEVARTL